MLCRRWERDTTAIPSTGPQLWVPADALTGFPRHRITKSIVYALETDIDGGDTLDNMQVDEDDIDWTDIAANDDDDEWNTTDMESAEDGETDSSGGDKDNKKQDDGGQGNKDNNEDEDEDEDVDEDEDDKGSMADETAQERGEDYGELEDTLYRESYHDASIE